MDRFLRIAKPPLKALLFIILLQFLGQFAAAIMGAEFSDQDQLGLITLYLLICHFDKPEKRDAE